MSMANFVKTGVSTKTIKVMYASSVYTSMAYSVSRWLNKRAAYAARDQRISRGKSARIPNHAPATNLKDWPSTPVFVA